MFLFNYIGDRGETVIMEACGVKKFITQRASVGGSIPPDCPFYKNIYKEKSISQRYLK